MKKLFSLVTLSLSKGASLIAHNYKDSFINGLAGLWGLGGLFALLFEALYRLWPHAIKPFSTGLEPFQWALYFTCIAGMCFAEGYLGFQKSFSPRAIARADLLLRGAPLPRYLYVFAPLFCCSLLCASPRRLRVNWGLVFMIVGMSVSFRYLPDAYRSILDAGVVAGLSWGTAVTLWGTLALFMGRSSVASAELSDEAVAYAG